MARRAIWRPRPHRPRGGRFAMACEAAAAMRRGQAGRSKRRRRPPGGRLGADDPAPAGPFALRRTLNPSVGISDSPAMVALASFRSHGESTMRDYHSDLFFVPDVTLEGGLVRHPEVRVKLTGHDGNAFAIIDRVSKAMRRQDQQG